jgi:hypothetical protein
MPVARVRILLVLVAPLVLAALGGGADASPGSAGEPPATWSIVPSPSKAGVGQRLVGVTSISATDAWAVGDVYDRTSGDELTLIQHWDGAAWKVVRSPNLPQRYHTLTGVSGASSNDVWAVGYTIDDRTGSWEILIEHWNGTAWSIIPAPSLPGDVKALSMVDAIATNDVWAVGWTGTQADPNTLALHWNGSTWAQFATPTPGVYANLYGVSAASSNDVWAVGYYRESIDVYESLALHWDGTAWTEVESANVASFTWFNAVTALGPDDAWAAGYAILSPERQTPVTEHWDGAAWTVVEGPSLVGDYDAVTGLAATSSTDVVAVGSINDQQGRGLPFAEHWDGAAWTQESVPVPSRTSNTTLFGVAPDGVGGYWAVGQLQITSPLSFKALIVRRSG